MLVGSFGEEKSCETRKRAVSAPEFTIVNDKPERRR